MNDKKIFYSFLVVMLMVVMAYLVLGEFTYYTIDKQNSTLKDGMNLSGNSFNLTIYTANLSGGLNSNEITNMSIMWQSIFNHSMMANYTYNNVTANQSTWGNNSAVSAAGYTGNYFDTTALPDGRYNISIRIINFSNAGLGDGGQAYINHSIFRNITVDNTKPRVIWVTSSGVSYGVPSPIVVFNASIVDTLAGLAGVIFYFDNASANAGNITASNSTGGIVSTNYSAAEGGMNIYWNVTINVSNLRQGLHTIRIFANDSASNINLTETITFTVSNTPHNVTWFATSTVNLSGQRFNISSNVVLFNVSIKNGTHAPIRDIIFMFDNASKSNQMNITNSSNTLLGQYWNASFNVSTLTVGTHRVTVFANDTLGHLNKTETLTFILDSTPHNVTLYTLRDGSVNGQNFSVRNTTSVFNFSVINSTYLSPIHSVILMFDNASGRNFNVSASIQGGTFGRLWNASYNVSELGEGSHTVTVFANDTLGNFNKTETFTFNVDKTAPGITVTCTSLPTVGDTVTCTCAATDSLSGVSVGPFIGSGSTATELTTASGTVPVTSSNCYATDRAGNTGTGTGSWTPVAASSGGSGASGGGGGQSSGVTGTFAKEVWTSINAGETAKVEVTNGAIGITEVSFSVADTTYGAWLKVEKKESLPSDVQSFSGKVYKNVEITENNVKKALTGTAKIEFKVTKVWLSENGLGKTDVAMHRYADGKWNELKTTVGEDDGTYQYYTAETTGFSYFVIGQKSGAVAGPAKEAAAEKVAGEKAAAGEEAVGEEAAAGEEVVAGAGKGIWTWVIVVLVIIALVAIAFWLKKR